MQFCNTRWHSLIGYLLTRGRAHVLFIITVGLFKAVRVQNRYKIKTIAFLAIVKYDATRQLFPLYLLLFLTQTAPIISDPSKYILIKPPSKFFH